MEDGVCGQAFDLFGRYIKANEPTRPMNQENEIPEAAGTPKGFDEMGLAEPILQAVRKAGYETPSPIQECSIPPILEGRDLLGVAQTGTGKTAAFSLPLLSRLDESVKGAQILVWNRKDCSLFSSFTLTPG